MKWWTNLLPLFFIKWYSRRHLMRLPVGNDIWVQPFHDVLIRLCPGNHYYGQTCKVCGRSA
jgi:hypothetical protein